ncbi:MAG: D-glycerate dehydrogenase [Thermoleophilia bacterium]|nr:D-glycerate dehydrogenase [Thermoleophilia bacterium]MDH5333604.1 D-glycerate dehydrogenase [Thermoleophilia bacterium]
MMPRVVVTRPIPAAALELLAKHAELWVSAEDRPLGVAELHEAVRGADAVVTLLHDRVDDAFLNAAGAALRVVANVAVGVDNVDVEACRARGVIATNTPGVLTDATADLALALILMVTRRLGEGERLLRRGERWSWSMTFHLGRGLGGKTLGVVGLGQIGTATARRCRALGMEVAYAGRRRAPADVERELEARFLPVEELLAVSDVVSLHCPLTPETRHLVDGAALRSMKPSAFLVNTTRGPVVDEGALVEALRAGVIAGAGLDVFEHEPDVHPGLLELENVVLLPHLGSATVETREAMAVLAARNVVAVLAGEAPPTPVT